MKQPTVSVLMTCFNTERYLSEAIESILGQTFTDFELIIVNDGSTDRSPEILKRYAAKDERVRVLSGPNIGIVRAARKGIEQSQGEFVARIDSDDIALPTRLEKQVAYLREHAEIVCVGSRVLMIDPDGDTLCEWGTSSSHEEIDKAHMNCGGPAIVHPAMMFRRDAMLAAGGYNLDYDVLEDLDLLLRLAERGRLANLPEALTKWRQHPSSCCHTRFQEIKELMPRVLGDADRRRGIERRLPEYYPELPGQTVADHHLKWAWWALNSQRVSAARKHALAALRYRPFSSDSWRAVACAMRGH